ncbi:NAD(P)-binding protein [Hypoxylon fuscum]|nr:NAD(P)-binding protein [Hypoxylon fuscum]
MASFLITGASRGLGLALARHLASLPASDVGKVFASARGDSPALEELAKNSSGRVFAIRLDTTNEASIKEAAAEVERKLEGKGLDVLINNAGICQYAFGGVKSMDNLAESFTTNVLGIHWVTRAFLPLLQKGTLKKVANISTTLGSITLARKNHYFPAPAYKISKAAMDALTWMKTDLGGGDMADLTPEEGAKASLDIIFKPGQEFNGQMPKVLVKGWENAKGNNQYDGTNAPW